MKALETSLYMNKRREANIIIEFVSVGNSVKVSAIDTESGVEATIIGSPKVTKKQLTDLAVRKLKKKLKATS